MLASFHVRMIDPLDVLVLGGGMRGLVAGLRLQRERAGARFRIVDAAPRPGGSIATQRTNGFLCELGPFGFGIAELAPILQLLDAPPPVLEALPAAATGHVVGPDGPHRIDLAELPVSFRSGAEELPQACRRQLGDRLLLGQPVTGAVPAGNGLAVTLGGEVPVTLHASELVLALPMAVAASLFSGLDPALAELAHRLATMPAAFVFLGDLAARLPDPPGYGWVPAAGLDAILAEAIVCSAVFAGRALPGKALVRCEVTGESANLPDDELVAAVTAEFGGWSGRGGAFGFSKVHRFTVEVRDAAWAECRARLAGFAARGAPIALAPEVFR